MSEKDESTDVAILERNGLEPGGSTMLGNPMSADILSALARAIHIPYHLTWAHELMASPLEGRFPVLASIRELPALLADW